MNRLFIEYSYYTVFKRGTRIGLRSRVNDSLLVGLRIIDSLLPVGRGQRQLILGDRYSGKTSIFFTLLIKLSTLNIIISIDGLGTRRTFGIYIGISINLSKLNSIINSLLIINWYVLILSTHSSSTALLSFLLPLIGLTLGERLRDRGIDVVICLDDLSKHSKSYRQISLLLGKIPSRDAYPADIFNIHSSLLERCSKLKSIYYSGSITAFPIIETINSDITEYIATNVISITDGQFYTNKELFINSIRPAIDSSLSVSRIGSNAQCKLMKIASSGIKNELTNYRLIDLTTNSIILNKLITLNTIFIQDHYLSSAIETNIILLIVYRNSIQFNTSNDIYTILYLLSGELFILYYIIFLMKWYYFNLLYFYINSFIYYFLINNINHKQSIHPAKLDNH